MPTNIRTTKNSKYISTSHETYEENEKKCDHRWHWNAIRCNKG